MSDHHRSLDRALVRSAAPAEGGLPSDNLRQFLDERPVILCRTCMRPLTWETRTEPGFLPRTGWYDDARVDALVCFKAADYRHVPLTDREWAYYEAGQRSVQVTDDGLAERVRTLADEWEQQSREPGPAWSDVIGKNQAADRIRALLDPEPDTCPHIYPDGTRCTLPDHSAPGLAEVHAPSADRDERDGA